LAQKNFKNRFSSNAKKNKFSKVETQEAGTSPPCSGKEEKNFVTHFTFDAFYFDAFY
jgi:hypothetical protein